jgi:uncharacterized membrane protein
VKNDADRMTERAEAVAKACFPLLAHHGSAVQGAALGELVALHIAGHIVPGDKAQTEYMRALVLEEFMKLVKALVPLVEATHILPRLNQ